MAAVAPAEISAQKKSQSQNDVWAGPVTEWPRVIPARINDGANGDLFIMTFGVKFYKPIPKDIFPLPPSGLCTWYYYYQHITDREVRLNADWIAPHGQSNGEVVKNNPGVFILKPDGTSPSKTWEGDWLLDPTSDAGKKYFHDLFTTMHGWGYEYFKIDGQPIVVEEYGKHSELMAVPGGAADSLYRVTLDIVRDAIGDESYLPGCWGLPVEGAGIMDGSRTWGDVVLGWDGFFTALDPTMESYWQHNIVWYTDPDVMLLRQPLTVEQARVRRWRIALRRFACRLDKDDAEELIRLTAQLSSRGQDSFSLPSSAPRDSIHSHCPAQFHGAGFIPGAAEAIPFIAGYLLPEQA